MPLSSSAMRRLMPDISRADVAEAKIAGAAAIFHTAGDKEHRRHTADAIEAAQRRGAMKREAAQSGGAEIYAYMIARHAEDSLQRIRPFSFLFLLLFVA